MMDDISIHVFKGVKLMGIYDKTTGFPRLDNELRKDGADIDSYFTASLKAYNLDEEWAKNRNREIEEEVRNLRSILSNSYVSVYENEEIHSKISELLEERDDNYRKYYGIDNRNREIDEEDGPDKPWAKNRNRDIEKEVDELREVLDYNSTELKPERVKKIKEEIESLLEERDKNTYKYGLAGKEFERLYLEKQHRPEVDGETRFRFITEEMVTLYSRKNTDYGNSFERSLDDDGLLVSKIRLTDKLNRFSQLIKNDNLVKDESLRDTLIDLANYTVMTLMYLDDNE